MNSMRSQSWLVLLLVTSILSVSSSALAQSEYRYAVIPMPTLGGQHSYAWRCNNLGVVAAAGSVPDGGYRGARYENGRYRDIGTLGGRSSGPRGINNLGWIVGRSNGPGSSGWRPFLWRDDIMIDLGTLGGDYGEARATNDLGEIAGYTQTIPGEGTPWGAFIWRAGVMTALAELDVPGSAAWGLNNTGLIVGQSWSSEFGEWRAVLWENEEVRDLGTLRPDGRGRSFAYDVNNAGMVVGQAQLNDLGRYRAFAWISEQMYDLGTIPGKRSSGANAVNNFSQVVGWATNGYPNDDAFIWEQGRGIQRLDQFIAPNARWRFNTAWDINDAGQIVGNGYRLGDADTSVGFLLTPVNPTAELAPPNPGAAGEPNTITVTNVTPGKTVHFLYSLHGGGTRIPGCELQQNALQLDQPTVIGSAIADGNGVATISRNVPLIARGQTVLFQAVVQNECAISQLVVWQFE